MSNRNQSEGEGRYEGEEEKVEPLPEDYGDDFLNGPEFQEHAEELRNKEILECLAYNTVNSKKDKERLMFQALYCLKKMEMDLNEKMVKEIEAVKDKYELMKQPLYTEVSNAALGIPVRKELYQSQGKNNKIIAKRIPDFWVVVMSKAGILNDQIAVDLDCFHYMTSFTCEFVEENFNYYKICFSFKQAPKYFSNKYLQISIKLGNEDEQAVCTIPHPIKYKLPKVEGSLFTQLFDNPNLQEIGCLATQINQCHRNALYFYFSKYHTGSSSSSQVDEDSLPLPNQQASKKVKSEQGSGSKTESLIQDSLI